MDGVVTVIDYAVTVAIRYFDKTVQSRVPKILPARAGDQALCLPGSLIDTTIQVRALRSMLIAHRKFCKL